jgi:hypothetical protein
MRPVRLFLLAAAAAAAFGGAPALAAAAPPVNDNYLASFPIERVDFAVNVDTSEATTQPDLFNPSSSGLPLGGGPPEPTNCKGVEFGKTVWYDLPLKVDAGVQIRATGFNTVVAVYEWSEENSQITRTVDCSPNAAVEDLLLSLKGGRNYTIQVGGAAGEGGLLNLRVDVFLDSDGDGVLDEEPDRCRTTPGIKAFGGCPPPLRGVVNPSIGFQRFGNGLRITRLVVDSVPKGARVVARCSGCGSQTVKVKRRGRVSLNKLVGKFVANGNSITLRVTLKRTGKGKYRYGATGVLFTWPVRDGATGKRTTKCLNVKTAKPERCR